MRVVTTMRRFAAFALVVAVVSGCGDDDERAGSTSTAASEPTDTTSTTPSSGDTTSSTAVPVTVGTGDQCGPVGESSSATVDEERGLYAAWVASIDVQARTLGVDVIQFLVGDDATAAYEAETGDPGGPPNDYYIRNESEQVRTFEVAGDVVVRVLTTGATLTGTSFENLPDTFAIRPAGDPGRLTWSPYWIAVNGGRITGICEQYVP